MIFRSIERQEDITISGRKINNFREAGTVALLGAAGFTVRGQVNTSRKPEEQYPFLRRIIVALPAIRKSPVRSICTGLDRSALETEITGVEQCVCSSAVGSRP
ncbi:hypothetical protein GJAV_G00185560 [Gymnothorax javanicus]|nr:hypothetical protein GJAV_G00185560 [Gymnothorax javanicus]